MSTVSLACQVDGPADAPPLVLLHALMTHGELWRPQLPAWTTRFRTLRIDLPGHGASAPPSGAMALADYADRVAETLDRLGIERAAIAGISLGGMVAQALALKHPRRVEALVLAHTTARTEPAVREIWERRLDQFERDGLAHQVLPTLDRWFTRGFASSHPLTMAWVEGLIRATAGTGYATAVRAIQALDHADGLGLIHVPTLVLAGDNDAAVPPAMASAMAQCIPGAELVILNDAGHLGNVQQPLRFAETVGDFLQRARVRAR